MQNQLSKYFSAVVILVPPCGSYSERKRLKDHSADNYLTFIFLTTFVIV